ncbi:MAG: hypothetical protein AUH85_08255 [Chloroflexi bacterium 13_1_40CM_4_68_4]|nr:MAG: hypothetical protein AUH85_08255 [Chloroflexi bacterium 13_1_40CM_4_68_4]
MRLFPLIATVAISLGLFLTGSALAADRSVQIKNFAFNPQTTNVAAGDTVTWVNLDPTAHRVHWTGGQFPDSPDLQQSQAYAVTFNVPGAYGYICGIHPQMQGVVNVQRRERRRRPHRRPKPPRRPRRRPRRHLPASR